MPLKLSHLAPSRIWAEVIATKGERVFVPTTETYRIGAEVTVELESPELKGPLLVTGTVQGIRALSGRFPAGVFVKVDEAGLEACRQALNARRDAGARLQGRSEPRMDCNFPARLLSPVELEGTVKSLSATGLTLHSTLPLMKDVPVSLSVRLREGLELQLDAVVVWHRQDLSLAGLRLVLKDPAAEAHLARALKSLEGGYSPTRAAEVKTVLVADDDPSILDFMSRVVAKAGYRVVPAERGDQALALVRAEKPDLVCLDVLMPGLDGLDVCKAMRAGAALARVPVVLLSAMGEGHLTEAASSAGASDFLTKPMRLEAVRAMLAKYLG